MIEFESNRFIIKTLVYRARTVEYRTPRETLTSTRIRKHATMRLNIFVDEHYSNSASLYDINKIKILVKYFFNLLTPLAAYGCEHLVSMK